MWKDLSLKDKSALMQIMVNNGIYDLSTIRDTYNKFAEGGPKDDNNNEEETYFGLTTDDWKDVGLGMLPVVGTYRDLQTFYKDPTLVNGLGLGVSAATDVATLLGVGALAKGSRALYKAYKTKEAISTARALAAKQATNTFKQTRLNRITDTATNKQVKSSIQSMLAKRQNAELARQKADFANTLFWDYTKRGAVNNIKKITNPLSYDTGANIFQNWWNTNNKFAEGGYVREKNNNPILFDEEGNLTDQITGEKGTMMLPNFNVYGSKEVADMVAQRRLNNLINQSEINPFTGETRVIGLERTYPEFELLGFKDLASPIFNSLKKGVTYSAAKLGNKTAQSKIIADMLDNSSLSTTLTAPITSRQISYTPKNTTVVSDATVFDNARRYQEFINRLNKDYEKAYLEGDVETGQRMWDNWFKFRTPNNKAVDTQGNPIKTYHTVSDQYDPSFNVFNTGIEGRPTAIYTTDNPIMSASYARTPVDETTLNVKTDNIRKYYDQKIEQLKNTFKSNYLDAKQNNFQDDFLNVSIDKNIYLRDLYKIKKEQATQLELLRKSYSPQRRKELYLNLENPLEIEGYGKSWQNIPIVRTGELENLSLSKNISKAREFANKHGIYLDDPNDILYLDSNYLIDLYLEKINKQVGRKDKISNYPIEIQAQFDNFIKSLHSELPNTGKISTRGIEDLIRYDRDSNFDSAIIKDIGDWGGNANPKLIFNEEGDINTGTVFESFEPSQLKYSQPFTFDDSGKLIPLSKRADFTNPDMRYSLLPIGLTLGGVTYLNQKNKNK